MTVGNLLIATLYCRGNDACIINFMHLSEFLIFAPRNENYA